MTYQRVRRGGGNIRQQDNSTNQTCNIAIYCPAESYSRTQNFSAVFGIIAFVTIVLLVAVYGVSWAMWTMDPGKDSIVYQMTAPRVKMD